MRAIVKRKRRKGGFDFSSVKTLKSSRMGKKKQVNERFNKSGITKLLEYVRTTQVPSMEIVDKEECFKRAYHGQNGQILTLDSDSEDDKDIHACP